MIKCPACGSEMPETHRDSRPRKFCSRSCANKTTRLTRVVSEESRKKLGWRRGLGVGFYHDSDGYKILTQQPKHFLSNSGNIAEHRLVLFEKIGEGEHPCHWCGKTLFWWGVPKLTTDHLDGDVVNNVPENLVPSCFGCNRAGRRLGKGHGRHRERTPEERRRISEGKRASNRRKRELA